MQNEQSGGVVTGLIFSTLFLVAIASLGWAPQLRIDGAPNGAQVVVPIAVGVPGTAGMRGGYEVASAKSVPVKLAPRRSFARRSLWAGRSHAWRSPQVFAARKLARPRT